MGVTTVVLLDKNPDEERIKNFWTPVQLKYKDRPEFKFVFVKGSIPGTVLADPLVLVTDWYFVPTYEGLLAIESAKSKDDIAAIGIDKMYDIRNY